MICPRCGTEFDVSEARARFNHYFSESAKWDYDSDLSETLCDGCAIEDVQERWMDGDLDAADGPPDPEDQKKWWKIWN